MAERRSVLRCGHLDVVTIGLITAGVVMSSAPRRNYYKLINNSAIVSIRLQMQLF